MNTLDDFVAPRLRAAPRFSPACGPAAARRSPTRRDRRTPSSRACAESGVAVMINWCGSLPPCAPLSRNDRRWCTPKRCCSSTMTRPSLSNSIDSWNSACVPTTSLISPLTTASSALRRARAGSDPVTSATGMSSARNQRSKFLACCSASSSVGAMSAACNPLPTARAAAAAATTVLPQPTSPCTSRTMGWSAARSPSTSASARDCARSARTAAKPGIGARVPPHRAAATPDRCESPGAAAATTTGAPAVPRTRAAAAPDGGRSATRQDARRAAADASS